MVVNAAGVEHRLGGRARRGAAARPGPQHPPVARGARRRSLGALEVGGRRAARQDARHRRARPDRGARRPARCSRSGCASSPTTPTSRPSGRGGWGSSCSALDELVATADFVTIHLPKTQETVGLFGKELLAKAKPGMRIVNAARGGIVDEEALAEAIRRGPRRRCGARRVLDRAVHGLAAVRLDRASSSPRTSAPARSRRRTRRASRSPSRSCSRCGATSCPTRSTSPPAERRRRCGRSSASPSSWGSFLAALCDGAARAARGRVPGRARRRGRADPHARRAEGRVRRELGRARLLRQRAAPRRGPGPGSPRVPTTATGTTG